MSSVKHNILANYAGHIWASLMGFIFAPLYIKFMGVESYGLVGISVALGAICTVLDAGLGSTVVRETARMSTGNDAAKRIGDFVRTLEFIYGIVAVAIGVSILGGSGWLARNWIKPGQLSEETVTYALIAIGLSLAARAPSALYSGGLIGLQKQLLFNGITIVAATLRGIGSVLVLWLISPTIGAFLVWRLIIDVSQTLCMGWCLWRSLPRDRERPVFRKEFLAACWKFSAGMAATVVFFVMMCEMDKIVLSATLPLKTFGYYSFASVAAFALLGFAYPITTAVFPRFAQMTVEGDDQAFRELYHQSAQLMTVVIAPIALVLVFFSPEALLAWTGQPETVENAKLLVSILVAGTGTCAILRLPHAIQLAHGWTWLGAVTNGTSVMVGLPLLVWSSGTYGAVGGALIWPTINIGQLLLSIPMMHRRLLIGEAYKWYMWDVGAPVLAALAVVGAARLALWWQCSRIGCLIEVIAVLGFAAAAAVCAAPEVRRWVGGTIGALTGRA